MAGDTLRSYQNHNWEGSKRIHYTNDNAGQLTGADYDYQTDETYVYDDNGNRVTANGDTYVTGDNNQLLIDDTYRYGFFPIPYFFPPQRHHKQSRKLCFLAHESRFRVDCRLCSLPDVL